MYNELTFLLHYNDLAINLIAAFISAGLATSIPYRLTHKISMWKWSYCPSCKQKIHLIYQIPVIGWILLQGRCKKCNQQIPFSYPLTEFIVITGWLLSTFIFPFPLSFFVGLLIWASIVITITDMKYLLIPNSINLFLSISGLLFMSLLFGMNGFLFSIYGLLTGGLFPFVVFFVHKKVSKKDGMGMGDLKLFAAMGTWVGAYGIIYVMLLSSILGLISWIVLRLFHKVNANTHLPFGPFISVAATVIFVLLNIKTNILP
ncbi:MAG: prepilin peptidase [Methanobacteriota archaeon]|nr:MAG: prepilin peptidase [Euryarchaeota archaeon]